MAVYGFNPLAIAVITLPDVQSIKMTRKTHAENGILKMLYGNLTPEDRNRHAPWTHLRLFKQPLGQYIGNSRTFTAKKGGHAFGHSLHTTSGIAAGHTIGSSHRPLGGIVF